MPHTGHVALAGLPNVGKSSLLNALVGAHLAIVSPRAQTTRVPVLGLVSRDDLQLVLHDLPGLLEPGYLLQERMRDAALAGLSRVQVILHLHPAADAPAPPLSRLVGPDVALTAPVLTLYTKGDQVSREVAAGLVQEGALVVSVMDGTGLENLVERLGSMMPEGEFEHDPDDVGLQPVRFFVGEYVREAAFEVLADELPYVVAAEVEEFREGTNPMYIRVTLFVERESQKAIVIGRGGQTLKAIGARARSQLEALTGSPVFLDTWVKVLPRWRRQPHLLDRLGLTERKRP